MMLQDPHRCIRIHRLLLLLVSMTIGILLIADVARSDYPHSSQKGKHGGAKVTVGGDGGRAGGGGGDDGYMLDWNNRDWAVLGNPNPGKCIDLPSNLSLCRGIGYHKMRLPNLLEHDTLREVSQQASSWDRLLAVRCHPDTQVFLCSLFAPVCLERPIWPCRSLCEAVKAGCEDRMLLYGFPWPEMLRCDQFPAENDLCIGLRNTTPEPDKVCQACSPADTFEGTVDHFCRADFVMRVKVKQAIITGSDMKIDTDKKKKIFKAGSSGSPDIRDGSLFISNGSSCDCPSLDGAATNGSSFVVMGNYVGDRPLLSYVHRLDRRSKEINRALRVTRKPDICTKSMAVDLPPPNATTSKRKKSGTAAATAGGRKAKTGKQQKQATKEGNKSVVPPGESKRTTIRSRGATAPPATAAEKQKSPKTQQRAKNEQKKTGKSMPTLFY